MSSVFQKKIKIILRVGLTSVYTYIIIVYTEEEVKHLSPRTGRPFAGETRKDTTVKVRMDEKELRQLDTCTEKLGISRSEALRRGLILLYERTENK